MHRIRILTRCTQVPIQIRILIVISNPDSFSVSNFGTAALWKRLRKLTNVHSSIEGGETLMF